MCEPQKSEASSVEVATDDKRSRFDALPFLEVSSAEVRAIERGDGFAQRVIGWLRSKGILGKKYVNDDTGWDNINVNNMSVRNVIQHYAKDGKVALLVVAPLFIKNGIYLETNHEKDGTRSHIFATKATLDGIPYAIGYVIRENQDGRRYYDHNLTKIEELDCLNSQAPETEGEAQRYLPRTSGRRAQTPVVADGKGTGLPQRTGPDSNPIGKKPLSNILKKHLKVNSAAKNIS